MKDLLYIIEEQIKLFESQRKITQLQSAYNKINGNTVNGLSSFLLGNAFGALSFVKDSYDFDHSKPENIEYINKYIDTKMNYLLKLYQNI